MMRKIINSILVVLITASMVWAVAPKYKIDPSSNMDNPPNIGVTTPGTGRFDTIKVTGASLSTSAGTGFYSLGTSSFIGDITISSNATTRANGAFIISGAFNYTGTTQGTAENLVIGTNAPNLGNFTDLTATTFIVPSSTIANFIATTSSATNFIATTSSIQNLNIGTSLTAGGLPGTSGQLLKSGGAGSLPTWTSSPTFITTTHDSAYVTNFNARTLYTEKGIATAGSLYGFIASGQSSLVPAGASGLVLTANGVSSLPSWQSASSGIIRTMNFVGVTSGTSSNEVTTSSGTWVPITGLTKTIAPISTSSDFFIVANVQVWSEAAGTACGLRLIRTIGAVDTVIFENDRALYGSASESQQLAALVYYDEPATASNITYSVQIAKLAGTTCHANITNGTTYFSHSTLTAIEVIP